MATTPEQYTEQSFEARTDRSDSWARDMVEQLESDERLDTVASTLDQLGRPLSESPAGGVLRGEWLGHALHPVLTDIPIGCWTSSAVLDLIGGRRARPASQRLVALGVLTALPTAASGLVELAGVQDQRQRRIGALHAAGNTVALGSYFMSWRSRRKGHHLRGVTMGLVGGTIATVTGYLGGHLSFARATGVEPRGFLAPDTGRGAGEPTAPSPTEAPRTFSDVERRGMAASGEVRGSGQAHLMGIDEVAAELTMQVEQVQSMVDQGLLPPVGTNPLMFRAEDVQAVRLQGG